MQRKAERQKVKYDVLMTINMHIVAHMDEEDRNLLV